MPLFCCIACSSTTLCCSLSRFWVMTMEAVILNGNPFAARMHAFSSGPRLHQCATRGISTASSTTSKLHKSDSPRQRPHLDSRDQLQQSATDESYRYSLALLCVVHLQAGDAAPVTAGNLLACGQIQCQQPRLGNPRSGHSRLLEASLAILQMPPHGSLCLNRILSARWAPWKRMPCAQKDAPFSLLFHAAKFFLVPALGLN